MGGTNASTGRGNWGQVDLSVAKGKASDAGKYAQWGGTEAGYNALTTDQWKTFQDLNNNYWNVSGGSAESKKALTDFIAKPYAAKPDDTGSIAPDLTDETLQAARKAAKLRASLGQGRSSTFLTGPAGDLGPKNLGTPSLLGGW